MKDLFDLIHLLQHPAFTADVSQETWQALVNECSADATDPARISYLLSDDLDQLFVHNNINDVWKFWRHAVKRNGELFYEQTAMAITDVEKLPPDLPVFKEQLRQALLHAGFDKHLEDYLPARGGVTRDGGV